MQEARDKGSIPGSGRAPGEGKATHSSILDWRIPWTEEPGGATVHRAAQSRTWLKWLSMQARTTQALSPSNCASHRLWVSLRFVRWGTRRAGHGESCHCTLAQSRSPESAPTPSRRDGFPICDWFSISTLQETENTADLISMEAMNLPGQVILCPSETHGLPQAHSEWAAGLFDDLGKIIRRNPVERKIWSSPRSFTSSTSHHPLHSPILPTSCPFKLKAFQSPPLGIKRTLLPYWADHPMPLLQDKKQCGPQAGQNTSAPLQSPHKAVSTMKLTCVLSSKAS